MSGDSPIKAIGKMLKHDNKSKGVLAKNCVMCLRTTHKYTPLLPSFQKNMH